MASVSNIYITDSLRIEDLMRLQPYESNQVVQNDVSSNLNLNHGSVCLNHTAAGSDVPDSIHGIDSASCHQASPSMLFPPVFPLDSNQQKYKPVENKTKAIVPNPPQILKVEPPKELFFTGPFNVERYTTLKLTNPTIRCVLFKIKTTAPDRYFVEQNFGAISAKGMRSIRITRKSEEREVDNEATSHMFMVQSCYAPEDFGDAALTTDLIKRMPADQISNTVLQCIFVKNLDATPIAADNENTSLRPSSMPFASQRYALDGLIDASSDVQEN